MGIHRILRIKAIFGVFILITLHLSWGDRIRADDRDYPPGSSETTPPLVSTQPSSDSSKSGAPMATPIRLEVRPAKEVFQYPEPVIITAWLGGERPISGAHIIATITAPSGREYQQIFLENLLFGTTVPGPGTYILVFTDIEEDGPYKIHVQADDGQRRAEYSEPFPAETPNVQPRIAEKSETTGSFRLDDLLIISTQFYHGKTKLPPLRVWDLYASFGDENCVTCVTLDWTVPLNIGSSGMYEIRQAREAITTEKAWSEADSVYKGGYLNQGGARESKNICKLPSGTFHFVIRSIDKSGIESELSNDYTVVTK